MQPHCSSLRSSPHAHRRLGAGECKPGTGFKYDSIRSHVYFSDFDWSGLEGGTLEPPHKPTEAKWLNVPDEELTDGAMELESYFLDGEATPLTIAEPSRGANTVDSPRASNVEDEQWLKFIQDRKEEEEIVRTGRIAKRKVRAAFKVGGEETAGCYV